MPTVRANGITMNYDQQGSGEPLLLIPYLTADYACSKYPEKVKTLSGAISRRTV